MTSEEFIEFYLFNMERTPRLTREEFDRRYVVMQCTCADGPPGPHWAAISNNEQDIESHKQHEELLAELRT